MFCIRCVGNRPDSYRDIPVQPTGITSSGGGGSINLQHQPGASLISSSSEDTFSFANGTLFIRSAKKVHQGFLYLCEASNGVGTGLSKVIRLLVNGNSLFSRPNQSILYRTFHKSVLSYSLNTKSI